MPDVISHYVIKPPMKAKFWLGFLIGTKVYQPLSVLTIMTAFCKSKFINTTGLVIECTCLLL